MSEGFGVETWCLDTYQPGRLVSGNTTVAQALYRRFTTPRGMLAGGDEEAEYGFDLSSYVGSVDNDTAVASLPALVSAEAAKDERVARVRTNVYATRNSAGETTIAVEMRVFLNDVADSFLLTLGVSDVSVEIIGGLPT